MCQTSYEEAFYLKIEVLLVNTLHDSKLDSFQDPGMPYFRLPKNLASTTRMQREHAKRLKTAWKDSAESEVQSIGSARMI